MGCHGRDTKPDRSRKTDELSGIDLMWKKKRRLKEHCVRNASTRCKGVGEFGSALLRHKLAQDEAREFRIGKRGSGMILMAWKWCRQVRVG